MPDLLDSLTAADLLRLLAFDAALRRLPRPFLDALWAGVDALESTWRPTATAGSAGVVIRSSPAKPVIRDP